MTLPENPIDDIFAANGVLAQKVAGFRAREQQTQMAHCIFDALRNAGVLVAEAGTGTGKTFAYLAPALLFGGKVIISTGTKTLQDQIFKRDLPTMRAALQIPLSVALLKGRANYVCHYYLERNLQDTRFLSANALADLRQIARFAKTSNSGDKSECSAVAETSPAWQAATSTRENCLGQECPHIEKCFIAQAREQAREAEIVIVNHHLFFADMALKSNGMGELLPEVEAVILDEAHQIADIASVFFGSSLTTGQVIDLVRDCRVENALAQTGAALDDQGRRVEKSARDLRLVFERGEKRLAAASAWQHSGFADTLGELQTELTAFEALLQTHAARSEGLESCHARCRQLLDELQQWQAPQAHELVCWVEVFSRSLSLHATPLSIADAFRARIESDRRAWIFTSATLAVGEDFSLYCRETGLDQLDPPARTAVWGSPFQWARQAVLYAPPALPDPNHADYADAVAEAAWPLLVAARGRAFVLCTSLKAMRRIHARLDAMLAQHDNAAELALMLQGEGTKSELLERFRQHGHAILVASQSFWEGVDVAGDALSLVIIDKLPFQAPDDPVLAARLEHLRQKGGKPFFDYQLPRAIINLKQGSGRLIRSEHDRGLLCICDGRLLQKGYGKRIWQSLPPMRRTTRADQAIGFLHSLETGATAPHSTTRADRTQSAPAPG